MDNISHLLNEFKLISIHNRIDPFFEADIQLFYESPDEFSLDLKRSRSKLSLYGAKHVAVRQSFFNQLKKPKRLELLFSKLKSAGICDWVLASIECNESDVINVLDIGKGRTIYKIITKNKKSFVIKEKTNNNQSVFNQIAKVYNMPAPNSFFETNGQTIWELSEFLDDQKVFHSKKEDLIEMYAKAAVFGDFLELGDRHFENYITRGNDLVAIDVSHLMEKDNEHWTKKYISGGLYEVCILQFYTKDATDFDSVLARFSDAYILNANYLFKTKEELSSYPLSNEVESQWVSANQFIQHMSSIYCTALKEMLNRICYKQLLQTIVSRSISLDAFQELKMFYLADYERISTFFRSEELTINIFDQIQKLAADHLGVTQQYFTDFNQSTKPILDCLESQLLKPSPILK